MENKYKVNIVPKAEEDLNDIFYYIALELNNKSAAEKLINKFSNKILRLQEFPFSCSLDLANDCKGGWDKLGESLKMEVIKTLESMSDDVVMDDIMYRLYLLDKVKKGQKELEMGNYHISEDIKEDIENW